MLATWVSYRRVSGSLAARIRPQGRPVGLERSGSTSPPGHQPVIQTGEEDLRQLWETEEDQRLTGARLWIEVLTSKGPLRPNLDNDDAVDVMWLLMSPDQYYRLVHRRRWTTQKYQRWLAASITELLIGHP